MPELGLSATSTRDLGLGCTFQHGHMKYVVNSGHFCWQLQIISYLTHSPNDLIWSNVSWAEFSFLPKPNNALHWCDPGEYRITHRKLKWPTSTVCVALLPTLNCLNTLPDGLYGLSGIFNELCLAIEL